MYTLEPLGSHIMDILGYFRSFFVIFLIILGYFDHFEQYFRFFAILLQHFGRFQRIKYLFLVILYTLEPVGAHIIEILCYFQTYFDHFG